MPAMMFVQDYEGDMLLTDYSFLIENRSRGRRVLFDLGLRKVMNVMHDTVYFAFPQRPSRISQLKIFFFAFDTIRISNMVLD